MRALPNWSSFTNGLFFFVSRDKGFPAWSALSCCLNSAQVQFWAFSFSSLALFVSRFVTKVSWAEAIKEACVLRAPPRTHNCGKKHSSERVQQTLVSEAQREEEGQSEFALSHSRGKKCPAADSRIIKEGKKLIQSATQSKMMCFFRCMAPFPSQQQSKWAHVLTTKLKLSWKNCHCQWL